MRLYLYKIKSNKTLSFKQAFTRTKCKVNFFLQSLPALSNSNAQEIEIDSGLNGDVSSVIELDIQSTSDTSPTNQFMVFHAHTHM